ncbi:MAG: Fic family protein, partial [Sulfurovaceae bacterium]|nr:Fic family protein [Sulfurovaceae bacterium]
MKNYYQTKPNTELLSLFKKADALNQKINAIKEHNSNLWQTILTKLKIEWTYNSNSIEGSTLSRGDTHFFLTEGLTVEGKPFKDFLDAKNHLEAIDYLYDIIANRRDVSEGLIKELNALILCDISFTKAQDRDGNPIRKKATPGEYKKQPNHVLLPNGNIHQYVEPIQVQPQMQELIEWIEQVHQTHHPILIASIVHYNLVRIHAFDDGNGRGARILMNLILMKNSFFPAVIRTEKKRKYLTILHQADEG